VIVTAPVRFPAAVGVKVTLIVQFAPAATLDPQVLVCAKSPEAVIWEMESAALPEFVNVTVWAALVVPTSWLLNVKLAGDRLTAGAGPKGGSFKCHTVAGVSFNAFSRTNVSFAES
jgi:hypothetical protein